MIYAHQEVSKKTRQLAGACIAATVALPPLAATFGLAAPLLIPIAVVMPFVTMTVLDGVVSHNQGHHA